SKSIREKASAKATARELIETAMNGARKRTSWLGGRGANRKNGVAKSSVDGNRSVPRPALSNEELEFAIQRYVELFDFAPVAYMTFDRTGRIEEANLAATTLLGRTRKNLVGSPASLFVWPEDLSLFLGHLLRCRSQRGRVQTELRLKGLGGK